MKTEEGEAGDGKNTFCCCSFLNFFLNWKIIALQYWFDFCHTSTWISHRCTYAPPSWTSLLPLPFSHPSRLLQSPSLSAESYIKFPLGLYFTYGRGMCFHSTFPLVPASPSYSPRPEVCPLRLCLQYCPANRFISTIFLDSTYMC